MTSHSAATHSLTPAPTVEVDDGITSSHLVPWEVISWKTNGSGPLEEVEQDIAK